MGPTPPPHKGSLTLGRNGLSGHPRRGSSSLFILGNDHCPVTVHKLRSFCSWLRPALETETLIIKMSFDTDALMRIFLQAEPVFGGTHIGRITKADRAKFRCNLRFQNFVFR